jgi:hypothetical protein
MWKAVGAPARPIEHGQLPGIPPIRLDAVARAARNQRRRDHITRHPAHLENPLQLETEGSRFVAAPHAAAFRDPSHESADRRQIRRQLIARRRPLARQQDRCDHRGRVLIN